MSFGQSWTDSGFVRQGDVQGTVYSGAIKEKAPHNPILERLNVIEYLPRSKTLLEKGVQWCDDKLLLPNRVKKIAFWVFAFIANVATLGLLLPLTLRIRDISYKMKMEKAADLFVQEVSRKIENREILPPPDAPIALKSDTRAFNQIDEYAIEGGCLWYRRKQNPPGKWQPLFFDGTLTNSTPQKISVDGANMVVIDDQGKVHYRKLFIEGRGVEEIAQRRFTKHSPDILERAGMPSETEYFVIDKTSKSNWKPKWFSLPLVNRIINIFTGKTLRASGIISHRGRFNNGYYDPVGSFHPSKTNVTTFYELEKGNHSIRLHDPWSPVWSRIHLIFPETEREVFVAESLDVSSSTLLSIGYSVDEASQTGKLKIITSFFDADTSGSNPFIPYAYEASAEESARKREKFMRFVPDFIKRSFPEIVKNRVLSDVVANEGWKEHALPKEASVLYNQITILQTGSGCDSREIRVAGRNKEGKLGFFYKAINGDDWTFEEKAHIDTSKPLQETTPKKLPENIRCTHQYESCQTDANQESHFSLENFGSEASYHPTLKMRIGSSGYDLPLHKRLGFKTFLGKTDEVYDLVLPRQTIKEDDPVFQAFGRRRVIPVRIDTKLRDGRENVTLKIEGIHPLIPPLVREDVKKT